MYFRVKDKHKWGTENLSVMKGILGNTYMWPVILIGWMYCVNHIELIVRSHYLLYERKYSGVHSFDWNYGRI